MSKENFLCDPFRVLERRIRGIKYAVIGESEFGLTELSAESETEARSIAALWSAPDLSILHTEAFLFTIP